VLQQQKTHKKCISAHLFIDHSYTSAALVLLLLCHYLDFILVSIDNENVTVRALIMTFLSSEMLYQVHFLT